ncbi:dihydrodipicolinate synthase family protein, partial [Fusobacterium perfoetens]|uniref:dihydrodipicolinate synthase family protein n=1 Tax=Fusobacterium perfoetens TaxID=852 RepID=UPI001F3BB2AB
DELGADRVVFNGPDEQLLSGLAMGADGGIGGTYGVMPELYLEIERLFKTGEIAKAKEIQYEACRIIYAMCGCKGNLYAVMKAILKMREGIDCGSVRNPLPELVAEDMPKVEACAKMID